jgi:hypothetical protein
MTKKFLVCKKQQSKGCDYTIGCGMTYEYINADSVEDAIEKTVYPDGKDEISSIEGDDGENLVDILIIPSDYVHTVDMESEIELIEQIKKQEQEQAEKESELALLEKLKKKYNK